MICSKMAPSNQEDKESQVRSGFSAIAPDYDRINDLMTFGLHRQWKREVVGWLELSQGDSVLDLCCGTGDLGYLCSKVVRDGCVVGIDFAPEMLEPAHHREGWCVPPKLERRPDFVRANALRLPFADAVFAGVTVGYGLRNLADLETGLREVVRVLQPGGRFTILETGPPRRGAVGSIHRLYLRYGVPLIGRFFHGRSEMYKYLASSALDFLGPNEMAACCEKAGLEIVRVRTFLVGASYAVSAMKRK